MDNGNDPYRSNTPAILELLRAVRLRRFRGFGDPPDQRSVLMAGELSEKERKIKNLSSRSFLHGEDDLEGLC